MTENLNSNKDLIAQTDDLTKKIELLSKEVIDLGAKLASQKKLLESLTQEKTTLYEALKNNQFKFEEIIMQKENDIIDLEKELIIYIEEKSRLQENVDKLTLKSKKYDDLQGNLLRIRLNAESNALKMMEDAQSQSMESISVIDDIAKEIEVFIIDAQKLKDDLKIGTLTTEDRLDSICYKLNTHLKNLKSEKRSFYKRNHLQLHEDE